MLSRFYTPWNAQVTAPARVIEIYCARCRVLGLPYGTSPLVVAQTLNESALQEQAEAESVRSVADLAGMNAFKADGYDQATAANAFDVDFRSKRHVALWGGRGGRKTTEIAKKLVQLASKEPLFIVCGREFMSSIKESSKAAMEKAVRASPFVLDWTVTEYQLRHVNGSRVVFIGMQSDPGSLDGIDIFWGDEAAFFSQHSLDRLIPTVRDGGSTCIWSWNPADGPMTPIDAMFRGDHVPEQSYVAGVMASDNPWLYRTALHMELRNSYRKAVATGNFEDFEHTWRGAFKSRSDAAVFGDISVGYIKWSSLACGGTGPYVKDLCGFDFGYGGADDSAAIAVSLIMPQAFNDYVPESGQRPVLYVHAEASEPSVPNHELHTLADQVAKGKTFYCDNAMPLMIDALRVSGVYAEPATKGPGSNMVGFRKLQSCEIIISPECPKALAQFQALRYEVDRKTGIVRKPHKVKDVDAHLVAAARYALSFEELSYLVNGGAEYV